MIIYHKRPDGNRSLRLDRNKSYAMYNEWKSQRQSAMDGRNKIDVINDKIYQERNKSDSYYQGLESRISEREAAKMPIAGEGAVQFFSIANSVMTPVAKLYPLWLPIKALTTITEIVAREKSGL